MLKLRLVQQCDDEKFLITVVLLAISLCRLGNGKALAGIGISSINIHVLYLPLILHYHLGLFSWCKEKANKRFYWLHCLQDLVQQNNELCLKHVADFVKGQTFLRPVKDVLMRRAVSNCNIKQYEKDMQLFR